MRARLFALFLALGQAGLAWPHSHEKGEIQVRHPWSRATPPGAQVAVGYMEIRNHGAQPDRLVAVSTPVAKRVEMHVTQREGEVMRMRQVKHFEIPARERVALRPGGSHLMLVDITQPLKKGERFTMRLHFERAGELDIELDVQEQGSRHARH
ncbi:MAG TPA: copper chaperone PCu(A)C [Burkholderiales bacterium]|nr:copper chaperone PCu(A)C [Burkholderiales bacterium]